MNLFFNIQYLLILVVFGSCNSSSETRSSSQKINHSEQGQAKYSSDPKVAYLAQMATDFYEGRTVTPFPQIIPSPSFSPIPSEEPSQQTTVIDFKTVSTTSSPQADNLSNSGSVLNVENPPQNFVNFVTEASEENVPQPSSKKELIGISWRALFYIYKFAFENSNLTGMDLAKAGAKCSSSRNSTSSEIITSKKFLNDLNCISLEISSVKGITLEESQRRIALLGKKLPSLAMSLMLLAPPETKVSDISFSGTGEVGVYDGVVETNRFKVGILTLSDLSTEDGTIKTNLDKLLVSRIPGLPGLVVVTKGIDTPGLRRSEDTVAMGKEGVRYASDGRPFWALDAFKSLPEKAWKLPAVQYGTPEYYNEFFARYGLHQYDNAAMENMPKDAVMKNIKNKNAGLPLGLIQTTVGAVKFEEMTDISKAKVYAGVTVTCEFCHSTYLHGKYEPGLHNVFANLQRLKDDIKLAGGDLGDISAFKINPPHNSVVSAAHKGWEFASRVVNRSSDLNPFSSSELIFDRLKLLSAIPWLIFQSPAYDRTAPWHSFALKNAAGVGFYYDGSAKDMNFLTPTLLMSYADPIINNDAFLNEILDKYNGPTRMYFSQLTAPRYPEKIDQVLAENGLKTYKENCSRCHGGPTELFGVYNSKSTLANPETDPSRIFSKDTIEGLNKSLQKPSLSHTGLYVAPPLAGIWARGPYLHNGSVPNLWQMLNPKERTPWYMLNSNPKDAQDFDYINVGWKFVDCSLRDNSCTTEVEKSLKKPLRIYNPTLGNGMLNQGHEFGGDLDQEKKKALIELLKTL